MTASPSVILHIGPHKTGTTYIQQNLLNNRAALAGAGVAYPDAFMMMPFGHNAISREMTENPEAAQTTLAAMVADLQARGQAAIMSAENMALMDDAQIEALHRGLDPLPGHVVVYLRARGPAIWSQWQEYIKFGDTQSFSDYVADLMLRNPEANVVDPLGLARRWHRVFGRLTLVDYDGCVAEGRDLTDPVLRVATGGPMVLPDMNTDQVNTRMPQERVEILRMLNLVGRRRLKRHPKNLVRKAFLAAQRQRPDVQGAVARTSALIRPRMIKLPLARLDGYFAGRDDAHAVALQAAGVAVPLYGARRPPADPETLTFDYLPDSAFLLTQILPSVTEIFEMLEIGAD